MSTSDLIALLGAAASTILGILAIWISLRANRISAAAEQLARRAYAAERRLAVASSPSKDEHGTEFLLLGPAGSDQVINSITLFFPRKTGISPIVLASGGLRLFHARIVPQLRTYWDSRTPVIPGYASVRRQVPTPVVAVVHGHTKGEAAMTVGYYDLYCEYARRDDGTSSLSIKSLTLNNYGFPNDDPQYAVDEALTAVESVDKASNPALQPIGSARG